MESIAQKEANDVNKNLLTSEEVQKTAVQPLEQMRKDKKPIIRIGVYLLCGALNIVIGILSIHFNYTELILKERIRMRPGLPPFEYWRQPPFTLKVSIYLFNVTNPVEFLDGIDDRLKLQEVGPIILDEIIEQKDIVFHDNSTLSFTTERKVHYSPEKNEPGILNKTIIMLNPTLLGLAAYLHDSNFVQKIGFKMLSRNDNVFLRRSIYEVLWNNTSPMLESLTNSVFSFLLPRDNSGIIYNAYYPKFSRYNVNIGTKNGFKHFFTINTFNGKPKIPGFENEERSTCPIWLKNARDGANLPPYISKDTVVTAWREEVSTTFDFLFEKEVKWENFNAYRYILPANSFNRLENSSLDCLGGSPEAPIPNGLIDASKTSFDIPTAYSFPHYYGSDGFYKKFLDGLEPDKDKHGSYTIIEPITGFPLEEVARMQSNLIVPKLEGFTDDIERFSNMILPGFWAEFSMRLPGSMVFITELIVIYVPYLQIVMVILTLALGIGFLYFGIANLLNIDFHSPRNVIYTTINPFRRKTINSSLTSKT